MPNDTSAPTFRQNADGTVTVTAHKHLVRISAAEVRLARAFAAVHKEAYRPQASDCWTCHAKAMYLTRAVRKGPELILMHYHCGACGMKEIEPFD